MARKASLLVLLVLLTAGSAVAALSGTYYIKKGVTSADTFPSFVAVGTALQTQGGLSGNVTFLAFAGTYDEGICYLQSYAGDSTYTTTFDKAPGQGEVIVTGTSASYCFYIYYTNNVKIKNLTLRPVSYGVYLNYSSGLKLQNCNILSGSSAAMIYYGHYDSVVGCNIGTTSYGIYFYGTSSPVSMPRITSSGVLLATASTRTTTTRWSSTTTRSSAPVRTVSTPPTPNAGKSGAISSSCPPAMSTISRPVARSA
jgi:hypothetical protein